MRSAMAARWRASARSMCSTPRSTGGARDFTNMLLSEPESKSICEKLLSYTKANDAAVGVSSEDYSHLRFAANRFTTNGREEQASASVTVWIDQKRGSAISSDLADESLKMAVAQAEQLARLAPVDKEYLPTLG